MMGEKQLTVRRHAAKPRLNRHSRKQIGVFHGKILVAAGQQRKKRDGCDVAYFFLVDMAESA